MYTKLDGDILNLPKRFQKLRDDAVEAIAPIRPADDSTKAPSNLLFSARRTNAGQKLPPYYLVYFLLVDLLGFKNLGRFEKLAWSVPIDYKGEAFLIEHRKFGLGVFVNDPPEKEDKAEAIVGCIQKAVKVAEPYFEWRAQLAIEESELNVRNLTDDLYQKFEFFLAEYRKSSREILARNEWRENATPEQRLSEGYNYFNEPYTLSQRNGWLASAVIDSFFSFTEHVFIHLAILQGRITSGTEVANLAGKDWGDKYKLALDIQNPTTKYFYDELMEIRKQHRNFIAHGSFGKKGEAFSFHSSAGAVPVLFSKKNSSRKYSLTGPLVVEDHEVIQVISNFMGHIWSGILAPARIYLQRSELPVILTLAADGTYTNAMKSVEEMEDLVECLSAQMDASANMDW